MILSGESDLTLIINAMEIITVESQSHYFFVSGSIDGTVRCWDTRSRRMEPIQILDEARDGISSLKVSEHELLTGSEPN